MTKVVVTHDIIVKGFPELPYITIYLDEAANDIPSWFEISEASNGGTQVSMVMLGTFHKGLFVSEEDLDALCVAFGERAEVLRNARMANEPYCETCGDFHVVGKYGPKG